MIFNKGKVCEFIEFNPKETLKKNKKYRKIAMENITPKYKFIEKYNYEEYKGGSKFKNRDTIFARITPCLENGKIAYINCLEDNELAFGSTEYIVLRAIENKTIPEFVYYYSISDYFKNKAISLMTGTSGRQRVQTDALKELEVKIPNIPEQEKIVKVLSNIDRKIKLNNETNNNLYKLAIKYLKEMQSDDEVALSTFGKIQGGYAFKSKDFLDTKTNNRIIKIKNLRNEISADVVNSQFVEDEVIEKLDNKFKIQRGNVAIAMTGAELGKTGFIYGFDNYYLNQRVGLVRGITREKELYLNILLLSQEFQDLLNSKGYGSAQPNVSTTDIENILIQNVEDENLVKFYETVSPIYAKIILNCEENLNLEQLRDTLLPKLMNGEIDLDNIEI